MRVCKKIFCAIISLALSFLVVMAGIFPAVIPASAEQTSKSAYEQTNVLDDLKKAGTSGNLSERLRKFIIDKAQEVIQRANKIISELK